LGGPTSPTSSATPLGTLDGSPLERRIPIRLNQVPKHLIQAVLAIEDQRFYQHHGLDIRRIGGALLANLKAGAITQGGSTLTQQLAKNLFLNANRTPLRKAREAALALVLERRYSKSAILEAYLNEIYLGQSGGRPIHGVGAAARVYFGKTADRLSLSESALLAGLIRAPNWYAPHRNPEIARRRRELVLQQMVQQKRITRAAADRAVRAQLPRRVAEAGLEGRWIRDYVIGSLPSGLPSRGVAIYTTVDRRLQESAERSVRSGLIRLRLPRAQAALVAIDPRTGDVLAMVGGRDYRTSQFNRAVDARRQPGSAFKPIVALTALAPNGQGAPAFTLASVVDDTPFSVSTERGPWEPANYDREFHGPVTLRQAMEQSLNVPFARIGMAVGPERIVETARRLGIASPLRAVPSLALGSSEVTLLELTRAYGVLAAAGQLASTRVVLGSARYDQPATQPVPEAPTRVADPAVSFLVTSALQGVVSRGTGAALNGSGRYPGLAGKTGTSSDWRDAWFVAFTPDLVVGVWVGFDDGTSLQMPGSSAALPIASQFLAAAASRASWEGFEVPDGITQGYVVANAGWSWECGEREYFLSGTQPDHGSCFRWGWERPMDELRRHARRVERGVLRALRDLISGTRDR
jgi:penicillin-binding protein 1B